MNDARAVMPTDLLALVSYNGRTYGNAAWTRERLGAAEDTNTLGLVMDQLLSFTRARSAWISVRRQRLQGLVGARRRGGRQAWEIDYLIDATSRHEVIPGLLDCAIADVGRSGGEKLFLRLGANSPLFPVVREAGFQAYQEEVLYSRPYRLDVVEDAGLRPVVPSDSYLLYRLYNLATPETTRRLEAATFNEWHAAQERQWLKNGAQLVHEENGEAMALVRVARLPQGVLLDLLIDGNATARTAAIVSSAVRAAEGAAETIYVLLPSRAESVARQLEAAGFTPRQEFVSLLRRTTRPQSLAAKMMPGIAERAIGV